MRRPALGLLLLLLVGTLASLKFVSAQGDKVLVCYWGTWSIYRLGDAAFTPENIPPNLCTHLVYSFFGLDDSTHKVISLDDWADFDPGRDMIRNTLALKKDNPKLKVTMAIGGWNQGSERYSLMAKNPEWRKIFVDSVVDFANEHAFDGVDVDWEYPAERGGVPEDKQNFPLLLKELREALDKSSNATGKERFVLSAAVGCAEAKIETAYDVPEIMKHLDYVHLMLYDFKMYLADEASTGGTLLGHHSPLFSKPWETEGNKTYTASYAVESFIRRGAPPEKLVFGVGTYGKTFTIFNRTMHNFYEEARGAGAPSEVSQEAGTSALFEICKEMKADLGKWEMSIDQDYKVPYAFSDTKWIGYDNEISARNKVDYAMSKGMGGMMVWSLDFDDFGNHCGGWTNFALTASLKDRLIYHENRDKQ